MESKNINPHLNRTDEKSSVKMKTKSKEYERKFKKHGGSAVHHVGPYRSTS